MKISELINILQRFKEEHGDLIVVSTGYYDDAEVESIELCETTKWPKSGPGKQVDGCRLLPGSQP